MPLGPRDLDEVSSVHDCAGLARSRRTQTVQEIKDAALRPLDEGRAGSSLPPGALALFIELRGRLHGLVMLELLGHSHLLNAHAGSLLHGTAAA